MYKPDGEDSIWVTLRLLTWYWFGVASKDGSGDWSLDTWDAPSNAPASVDWVSLPVWDDYFSNLEPVEEE
jgi:hypothetical protein